MVKLMSTKSDSRSFRRSRLSSRQARDLRCRAGIYRLGIARQHRAEIELRVAVLIGRAAVLDRTEMMFHDGNRGIGIAPPQCRDDLAMLIDRAIRRMRPSIQCKDQRATRHHLTEITPQQAIARQFAKLDVEFAGEPARHPRIADLTRSILLA